MPSESIDDPGILSLLSHDRMTTYLTACGGDPSQAIRLYSWNVAISSAFWGGFNVLEVALRNTIHAQLAAFTRRADWWNAKLGFHPLEIQKLNEAVRGRRGDELHVTDGRRCARLPESRSNNNNINE